MWQIVLVALVALVLVMEWRSSAPVEPRHSLDCLDGVADENCTHRAHHTREEVEFIQSLDSQIGFKP